VIVHNVEPLAALDQRLAEQLDNRLDPAGAGGRDRRIHGRASVAL
jgi:hypothetical protein